MGVIIFGKFLSCYFVFVHRFIITLIIVSSYWALSFSNDISISVNVYKENNTLSYFYTLVFQLFVIICILLTQLYFPEEKHNYSSA